ncbi:hypothetical protein Y032_0721g1827 [Ancylostoma ceylanicum]|uniref:Uncharacterized protein n=2 Tax=Ancylostoma ceylanicum TaxID=53326 RepID=A0A016WH82_9BILA|nr:hypothetical protein Y032_0721g1827 [Ancylostoma ceylanicum]
MLFPARIINLMLSFYRIDCLIFDFNTEFFIPHFLWVTATELVADAFHSQFLLFAAYICLVQQLQYQYQSGCLRRLHSLGHGDSMDVTLEGFATWMFQGLTFLLPFLAIVYMLELYNAYTLFSIWKSHDCVWQVPALSLLFLIVGVGNIAMVAQIVLHKMTENNTSRVTQILRKYPSMAKIQ